MVEGGSGWCLQLIGLVDWAMNWARAWLKYGS